MTPPAPPPWPHHAGGARLRLHTLRPGDLAAGAAPAWLAEAETAAAAGGAPCRLSACLARGDTAYWLLRPARGATDPIGALAVRQEGETLLWRWLALAAGERGRGLAGIAVPIVERLARRRGCLEGRVDVPAANGVGFYFWLRLGYSPAPKPSGGSAPATAMRRPL